MRRGVVGALASGDARVRRACGAVRKGARAEAGWCRAPHARAEGFMGVRLRTFSQVVHNSTFAIGFPSDLDGKLSFHQ